MQHKLLQKTNILRHTWDAMSLGLYKAALITPGSPKLLGQGEVRYLERLRGGAGGVLVVGAVPRAPWDQ